MAITTSGIYARTLASAWENNLGESLEVNGSTYTMLVEDGYTPDFADHNFRNDVTNEVSGTGYNTGGQVNGGEVLSVVTDGANRAVMWDINDLSFDGVTLTGVMAAVMYFSTGVASTDPLIALMDFVTAVDVSSGTLLVQIPTTGVFRQYCLPTI